MPIDQAYLQLQPDVLICTHNHLDHLDPETVPHYLNREKPVLVLSPNSCFMELKKFAGDHNYVKFDRHVEWTQGGVFFKAVKAEHSDPTPIGVIIDDGDMRIYITGDTLYNEEIFDDVVGEFDAVFLPINGVGNNMNLTDAARFAKKIKTKAVVPVHWGMFDELTPEGFAAENKVIPELYKKIHL